MLRRNPDTPTGLPVYTCPRVGANLATGSPLSLLNHRHGLRVSNDRFAAVFPARSPAGVGR
jgi:hypothetical protein